MPALEKINIYENLLYLVQESSFSKLHFCVYIVAVNCIILLASKLLSQLITTWNSIVAL